MPSSLTKHGCTSLRTLFLFLGNSVPLWLSSVIVSLREGFGVYAWDQLQGVFVVDLFQDFVGDFKAVDTPEGVAAAVILEIFVACFQRAKIPFVFVHVIDVFAHYYAGFILHQEIMRRIGLPPQPPHYPTNI